MDVIICPYHNINGGLAKPKNYFEFTWIMSIVLKIHDKIFLSL